MSPHAANPARPPTPFADALARSGLVTVGRAAAVRSAGRPAAEAAAELVAAGELTPFQAEKLLAGQWHGLVLGRYAILAPLGRGGMGIVYLAREVNPEDRTAARPLLALKILPPRRANAEPRTEARFLREMALGEIVPAHRHIARVYETGNAAGVNYIAMEYVPGDTLKAVVAAGGPLPVPVAARVIGQAADALTAAHAAGLVHRDLKPANLMVTPAGAAKLLDFGLALKLGEELPDDPTIAGGRGYALGTMDYIAPEQSTNAAAVTPAADLYALGGTLYYALAGCPPFPGGSVAQKIRWHRQDEPQPIRTLNPAVPAKLAKLLERLMAKDPADRPASAAEVMRELAQWSDATPAPLPIARPVVPNPPIAVSAEDEWDPDDPPPAFDRQTRLLAVALGGVLLAVIGLAAVAGYLLRNNHR